jgi:osmotically-inducible protein OsmY
MNRFRNFITLSIAIMALVVVSVPAQSYAGGKKYGNKASDSSISQQIYHELRMLPHYGVFDHITYQVNGGNVTLSGKVYSLGTTSSLASIVKRIPGVTNVVNNIEDLPPSPSDDRIRREALRTFANRGLSGYFWEINPDVRIIVDRGHITLEGYVMNKGDLNAMNIYANGISGVFSVQNNLIVGTAPKG